MYFPIFILYGWGKRSAVQPQTIYSDGQIIAVSEGYTAMASCVNGVASVQKNAVDAETVIE